MSMTTLIDDVSNRCQSSDPTGINEEVFFFFPFPLSFGRAMRSPERGHVKDTTALLREELPQYSLL